jgi:PAS domain S-box-containing protein
METIAKRSEERLLHDILPPGLLCALSMGFIIYDKNLKILEWNKQAENIFGFSRNEIVGKNILDSIVPSGQSETVDTWQKKISRSKYSISAFYRNVNKNLEVVYCSWYTMPVMKDANEIAGYISLVEKASPNNINEISYDSSNVLKAFSKDATFNLILNFDTQEIEYVNPNVYYAFALINTDSLEKSNEILKFVPQGEHFRIIRHFKNRAIDKKNVNLSVNLSFNPSLTHSFHITGHFLNIQNKRLFVLNVRILKNDRTRWKTGKSETDFDRRLFHSDIDNLQNKNRLELLGDLTAGIVHEINQPLGILKIILDSIRQKSASGNITLEYLDEKCDMAQTSVNRMCELIDEIRIFRKEVRGSDIKKVNLIKPLHKVLDLLKMTFASNKIKVTTRIQNELPVIIANEKWLTTIISNLLTNSKYSVVKKSNQTKDQSYVKEIRISTWYDNERIYLQITDNGLGIKKKHLDDLFDPFFTTKGSEGSGLGLAIVNNYMKELNGSIEVDTQENLFATFTLAFPRVD